MGFVTYTKLLNKKTNQIEQVDNANIADSLSSGNYAVVPNEKIPLVDKTGNIGWHDTDNWDSLIEEGYKLPSASDITTKRDYTAEKERVKSSPMEGVKAALEGVARGATLGISDVVLPEIGVTSKESMKLRKDVRPVSAGIGEFGGILGSLLIPGPSQAKAASALSKIGKSEEAATTALKALEYAKTAAQYTPVKLAQKGGQIVTEALGGGALGRIAGTSAEMVPYGAMSSITEAALGDPDEAAEHLTSDMAKSALFGGALATGVETGLKGLGIVGKALGLTEKNLIRPLVGKLAKIDVNSEIFKQFDNSIKSMSIDVGEDLNKIFRNIPKAENLPAGMTPTLAIQQQLAEKYPTLSDAIFKHITPETTIADIPELQNILYKSGKEGFETNLAKMTHGDKKPGLVSKEVSTFERIVKDSDDVNTIILNEDGPKLESFYEKLNKTQTLDNESYKDILSKMSTKQLESAKASATERLNKVSKLKNTEATQKSLNIMLEDINKELSIVDRPANQTQILTGLDDYLVNNAKLPIEQQQAIDANFDDLSSTVQKLVEDAEFNGSLPKSLTNELKVTRQKLDGRFDGIDPFTNTPVTIYTGIRDSVNKNNLIDMFESLRAERRRLQSATQLLRKSAKITADNDYTVKQVLTKMDNILKDNTVFGQVADTYSNFNAISSTYLTAKENLLKYLFKSSRLRPIDGSGIYYKKMYYRPDMTKITKAFLDESPEGKQALDEFVKNFEELTNAAISKNPNVKSEAEILKGLSKKSDIPTISKLDKTALVKNLGDLKTLVRLSKTGSSFSTDLEKSASKYGPLGLALYFLHVPLPTIAAAIAAKGMVANIAANPIKYFDFIGRQSKYLHTANQLINKSVKSKLVETAKIMTSKTLGSNQESISNFNNISKNIKQYNDEKTKQDVIFATNDLNPNITPKLHESYFAKTNNLINYVQSKLPKGSNVEDIIDNNKDGIISDAEKRRFLSIYRYALDPMTLIHDFPNISMDAVQTVQSIYPKIFKRIQDAFISNVSSLKTPLNNIQKEAYAKILGSNTLVNSVNLQRTLQANWAKTSQEAEQATQSQSQAMSNISSRMKLNSQKALE